MKDVSYELINIEHKRMLQLTMEELQPLKNSRAFYLYNENFSYSGNINCQKVKDHCHFTGEFRGAAHNKFNILY